MENNGRPEIGRETKGKRGELKLELATGSFSEAGEAWTTKNRTDKVMVNGVQGCWLDDGDHRVVVLRLQRGKSQGIRAEGCGTQRRS